MQFYRRHNRSKRNATPLFVLFICTGCLLAVFPDCSAQEDAGEFTLKRTIQSAISANIELKILAEETRAAAFSKHIQHFKISKASLALAMGGEAVQ